MMGLYVEVDMLAARVSEMTARELQEFEDIFREHHQLVYRTACVMTGRPEDAEDVLQKSEF